MSAPFAKRVAGLTLAAVLAATFVGSAFAAPLPVAPIGALAPQSQIVEVGHRRHHGVNGAVGAAIALGVLGLGVAAIASRQRQVDREDAYYQPRRYYPAYDAQPEYDGEQDYYGAPAYAAPRYAQPQRFYAEPQRYYAPPAYGAPFHHPYGGHGRFIAQQRLGARAEGSPNR